MPKYAITPEDSARLANSFQYHAPKDDQAGRYAELRETAKSLAVNIMFNCPPSRERSLALTYLEQSVMWANSSIARNE